MIEYGQDKKSSHERTSRPSFSDITGQQELKQALLAVGANDELDGLLIQGEKGTAKSTAVRALGELLGEQRVVADCPYGCPPADPARQCADCRERTDPPVERRSVPLVTLPLGATRERVVGTLSVADALAGEYEFDPGLLARANRGILYVDEVNLLDDHLVDVLLDAAASGQNQVERDGVSVSHPAEFTLVGTMNPEEGELRPQLRDRFALQTTVTGCPDLDDRVEIIDRALGETDDSSSADDPRDRFTSARQSLDDVVLPREYKTDIAELCRDAGIDGHRGDIATARAARTLAALDGRSKVIESDVRRAAELALAHRLKSRPFEDPPDLDDLLDEQFGDEQDEDGSEEQDADDADGDDPDEGEEGERDGAEADGDGGDEADDGGDADPERSDGSADQPDHSDDSGDGDTPSPETEQHDDQAEDPPAEDSGTAGAADPPEPEGESSMSDGGDSSDAPDEETEGQPLVPGQSRAAVGDATAPEMEIPDAAGQTDGSSAGGSTRTTPTTDGTGSRVRTTSATDGADIDAAASVRAAAARGGDSVQSRDLRQSVRVSDSAALVLFVVDASASMRPAMRAAKGTLLDLLDDAYRNRDEVGFVAFAGERAEVLLPPTDSVTRAARHLKELPTGDRTPLPDGLRTAGTVLNRADPATSVVVLVTDGKANVADGSPVAETRQAARRLAALDARVLVVDAGDEREAGLVGPIVEATGGERVPLAALSADRIDAAVGGASET
ncbi:VWA domain-containing protein [Halovenus sp. WSH3]|uniref:VWA domain-containing protein n=1 Tax=Halovenus carboxidivorans TaxID=2692199 RepID=A0A6B0SXV3_9EURY|nr:VWA domain-containing protein [Halovenus carboxidivorans]MXR50027.1 VWA domain-containing protein [Halovenus carboxidivorans]